LIFFIFFCHLKFIFAAIKSLGISLQNLKDMDIQILSQPQNCLNAIVELKLNFVGSHLDLSELREFMTQLRMVQKLYLVVLNVDRYCVDGLQEILPLFDHLKELEVYAKRPLTAGANHQASEFFAVVRDCCLHLKTLAVPLRMLEETRNHFGGFFLVEESKVLKMTIF
jgi:hypothetical protein